MCQCPSFSFGTVDEVLHCMHSFHQLPVSQVPKLGGEVSRLSTGITGAITDHAVLDKEFMLPTAEINYICSAHAVCSTGFIVLSEDNKCTNTIPEVKSKGSSVPAVRRKDIATPSGRTKYETKDPTVSSK